MIRAAISLYLRGSALAKFGRRESPSGWLNFEEGLEREYVYHVVPAIQK